ncbi:MAG TPA: exo-alpha-sialidase [Chitinophagales bacterium]|nr:exo-alpha-sialidase [Chitinophagales bacterium]
MKNTLHLSGKIFSWITCLILVTRTASSQWSTPLFISQGATSITLNEYMASCLAVSGTTLHVVWCDHRTTGNVIYYTHSTDTGFTWSTAIPLTDAASNATWPAVAASGSYVHVVWYAPLAGHTASFYKRSVDGGTTWGASVVLDSITKFWPGLAASGSMVAVSLNKEVVTDNTEVFLRVSTDNGATWQPKQQISNAMGRSEDPCVAVLGSHIHLSWNDKRSGTMLTYYRHSPDGGATWGSETALSTSNSYTEMVSLSGPYVDVPHGISPSVFNVWLSQSADTGSTFAADRQVTNYSGGSIPSWLVRDGMSLHLVFSAFGTGETYLHSADGGATWDSTVFLHHGGPAYTAITGTTLHVILSDSGKLYYMRNPTGNLCSAPVPAMPGTITGPAKPCPGDNGVSYSIAAVNDATSYNWTAPANASIASGQGTTNITLNFATGFVSGTLSVRAVSVCGESSARNKKVSRNIPATPGTLSGQSTSLCGGITTSYSINPVNLATVYNWTPPAGVTINSGQGTTALDVTYPADFTSGVMSVAAGNSCGTSNARNLNVTSAPATPGAVSGPAAVCANQSGVVYSIGQVAGATSYTWIVPAGGIIQSGQGTTSITVNFGTAGGSVKVKAVNGCRASNYKKLVVTIVCRNTDSDNMNSSISVSPNPSSGKLTIRFTIAEGGNARITFIDLTGRAACGDHVMTVAGENVVDADAGVLAKGIYLLRIDGKDFSRCCKVIIEEKDF